MIKTKNILLSCFGALILAFGLYNIHSFSGVTEGGALGIALLLKKWFNISPSYTTFCLCLFCYGFGIKVLGKEFLVYSLISSLSFSLFYKICEFFPPLWPDIAGNPFLASIFGALFVGIGVGLCIRYGGAPTADDAMALSLSEKFGFKIESVYLISDVTVLALSLTYIPIKRIMFSFLSVIISGKLVGIVQRLSLENIIKKDK